MTNQISGSDLTRVRMLRYRSTILDLTSLCINFVCTTFQQLSKDQSTWPRNWRSEQNLRTTRSQDRNYSQYYTSRGPSRTDPYGENQYGGYAHAIPSYNQTYPNLHRYPNEHVPSPPVQLNPPFKQHNTDYRLSNNHMRGHNPWEPFSSPSFYHTSFLPSPSALTHSPPPRLAGGLWSPSSQSTNYYYRRLHFAKKSADDEALELGVLLSSQQVSSLFQKRTREKKIIMFRSILGRTCTTNWKSKTSRESLNCCKMATPKTTPS